MDAALDPQKDGLGTRIYERMEGDAVSGAYKPPQASQLGEDVEKIQEFGTRPTDPLSDPGQM